MCDISSFSSNYENCDKSNNIRCEKHVIVTYSNVDYAKPYHTKCVASSFYNKPHNEVDFTTYTCIKYNVTNILVPNQWDILVDININNVHGKLGRFGILHIDSEAIRTINKLKSI